MFFVTNGERGRRRKKKEKGKGRRVEVEVMAVGGNVGDGWLWVKKNEGINFLTIV